MATNKIDIRAKTERSLKDAILKGNIDATRDLFDLYTKNGAHAEGARLSQATFELAMVHLNIPNPENYQKAIRLFEYASDLGGHFESMCALFDYYMYNGTSKEPSKLTKLSANMHKLVGIYETIAKTNTNSTELRLFSERVIKLYEYATCLDHTKEINQLFKPHFKGRKSTVSEDNPAEKENKSANANVLATAQVRHFKPIIAERRDARPVFSTPSRYVPQK